MREKNNFEETLNEALLTYNEFGNHEKEYAPIYNSRNMLEKIQNYYENNIRNVSDDLIAKINVGLLAAKALDFEKDNKFYGYSQLLHNIWNLFMRFLNQPDIPSSDQEKKAYDFYIKQGFTKNQAKSHLQGIDFSKRVDDNHPLYRGDLVSQWRNVNIQERGNYYSEDKKIHNSDREKNISCLGIYHEQEDHQGNRGIREPHCFSLQESVFCLKSIAAAVLDTWSIKGERHQTKGGCIQYFNAKNKIYFQQIPIIVHR